MRIGVVIVTFNSSDVILTCLESLVQSSGIELDICVVDNGSTDNTLELIEAWRRGHGRPKAPDYLPVTFSHSHQEGNMSEGLFGTRHRLFSVQTGDNLGFAGGVNTGLNRLAQNDQIDRFWVLNPDALTLPNTAAAFSAYLDTHPEEGFIGGRVLYADGTQRIQIDGGTINTWTGVTGNLNLNDIHEHTPPPNRGSIKFITGANMFFSRDFFIKVGPMPEEYFLYYEEVDWALRQPAVAFGYCNEAIVYHFAGTAIGSPTLDRPASPLSLYFKHRSRIRFVMRYYPISLPTALLYSVAKATQLAFKGFFLEAFTILRGSFFLPPSADIRAKVRSSK